MKKVSALFASVASVCIPGSLVATNATAEPTRPNAPPIAALNPSVLGIFGQWSFVKGTIKVSPSFASGPLAGMTCADIIVTSTSQAMNPPAPGGLFNTPKWTHHVAATGNFASGSCSYSMTVPHSSNFAVTANGVGPGATGALKCYYLPMGFNPSMAGWFSVPMGGTKEQDFTLTSVTCASVPT